MCALIGQNTDVVKKVIETRVAFLRRRGTRMLGVGRWGYGRVVGLRKHKVLVPVATGGCTLRGLGKYETTFLLGFPDGQLLV